MSRFFLIKLTAELGVYEMLEKYICLIYTEDDLEICHGFSTFIVFNKVERFQIVADPVEPTVQALRFFVNYSAKGL